MENEIANQLGQRTSYSTRQKTFERRASRCFFKMKMEPSVRSSLSLLQEINLELDFKQFILQDALGAVSLAVSTAAAASTGVLSSILTIVFLLDFVFGSEATSECFILFLVGRKNSGSR